MLPATKWDTQKLKVGQRLTYVVNDNAIAEPTAEAKLFKEYLSSYELDAALRAETDLMSLSTPLLSLPVNRSSSGFQSSISLAGYNDFDIKKSVDAATSRSSGSIGTLAVGRLASKFRTLLEKDTGATKTEFPNDPQVKKLTAVLKQLGYDWELECIDAMSNRYDVRLFKQGTSFLAEAASSGEKELLTYLFAIYALNVRDALVIVDEPELHLHPKWQATLLNLFEQLAKDTGNQFLLATHSPVFVAPTSIQYVSRIYSQKQESHITRLKSEKLPQAKHLFAIVNSQNNERIFFADIVVLVEGISDKFFFEKIFERHQIASDAGVICEVIGVGGKAQFAAYGMLLEACQIPYVIIADLDYVFDVGSESIKNLFAVDPKDIRSKVIDDAISLDGQALVLRLEEAINSGQIDDLKALWGYIKSCHRRLRTDLSNDEQKALDEFLKQQKTRSIFILSKGDLEAYLPVGYRAKNLGNLIKFVSEPTFWDELSAPAQKELMTIAESIKEKGSRIHEKQQGA